MMAATCFFIFIPASPRTRKLRNGRRSIKNACQQEYRDKLEWQYIAILVCTYQGRTYLLHWHLSVGYCCSQIDKVILQHDDCQGYETYKANECTANDLAALHVLQKTLKGTLGNQLNGENIKNSNTTCIYSNLSCTQIGIVEQEEYTSYTEEHEQQISCRTHDTLGSYAHDG